MTESDLELGTILQIQLAVTEFVRLQSELKNIAGSRCGTCWPMVPQLKTPMVPVSFGVARICCWCGPLRTSVSNSCLKSTAGPHPWRHFVNEADTATRTSASLGIGYITPLGVVVLVKTVCGQLYIEVQQNTTPALLHRHMLSCWTACWPFSWRFPCTLVLKLFFSWSL